MSNRTRNSFLNMSVGVFSQAINLMIGFVSRTFFIHFLSVEYLGINGLLTNVLTVLSFAELGIGEAMVYAMYKPAKENDFPTMRKLMKLYKKTYTCIAFAVGIIGVVLSFFVQYFTDSPPDIPENLQIIFLFYCVNNMLSYFLTYKKSLLIAYQQNYVINGISQAIILIQHILQIAVLALTKNYYFYLTVQIIFTVFSNLMISVTVNRKYPWLKEKENEKLPKDILQSITKNIKSLSIAKIAGVVSNGTDNIMISKFCGLTAVGLASNYTMITNSLHGIVWSGLNSITSSFGNFNVDSSVARRRDLFEEIYFCSYWVYGFLSVGVIVCANPLITLWLGSEFLLSDAVVCSLVLIAYMSGVNFPVYAYYTTLGMYDKMKYPYLASGLLNIVLSIILGLKFGMLGVYFATSISRLLTSELFGAYYVYKFGLQLPPRKYALKYAASIVLLIVNAAVTKNVTSHIVMSGMSGFAVKVLVCSVIYNGIFILMFWKTAAFKRVRNRILKMLNRKR